MLNQNIKNIPHVELHPSVTGQADNSFLRGVNFNQMKLLELSGKKGKGIFTKVDDDKYDFLMQWRWYPHYSRGKFYAIRNIKKQDKTAPDQMHRLLLGLRSKEKVQGDHIDGDGLNNQLNNLRKCTRDENMKNMKANKNALSQFSGVSWHKGLELWTAKCTCSHKRVHLGYFKTEEDAARAFNIASKNCNGEFSYVNDVSDPFKVPTKATETNTKNRGCTKKGNRFESYFRYKNKRYYLGSFRTEIEAAIAYNKKAKEILGENAVLNIIN